MRLASIALVLWALPGCGGDVVNPCNVDLQIAAATGGQRVGACGSFTRGGENYTDAAMLAAQRCVLNAIANKQAFSLAYDADSSTGGMDAGLRAGWSGTVDSVTGVLTTRAYAGRGGGDMASKSDLVSAQACDSVSATPGCVPRVGVPCLSCDLAMPAPATVQCRG